jgi:hypothetical protein
MKISWNVASMLATSLIRPNIGRKDRILLFLNYHSFLSQSPHIQILNERFPPPVLGFIFAMDSTSNQGLDETTHRLIGFGRIFRHSPQ